MNAPPKRHFTASEVGAFFLREQIESFKPDHSRGYLSLRELTERWEAHGLPTGKVEELRYQATNISIVAGLHVSVALHQVSRTSLKHRNAWRWWFACPSCTRQCAVLYFRGATAAGCLVCMDLAYLSQSQGSMIRGIERNQRIYKTLGWNPAQPTTWCRPKGMWRKTLLALSGQLDAGYARLRVALDGSTLCQVPSSGDGAIAPVVCEGQMQNSAIQIRADSISTPTHQISPQAAHSYHAD